MPLTATKSSGHALTGLVSWAKPKTADKHYHIHFWRTGKYPTL